MIIKHELIYKVYLVFIKYYINTQSLETNLGPIHHSNLIADNNDS